MASKNLGQVEGLYIGSSAPANTALIWYDTSSHVHKVYDTTLSAWKVLDQNTITAITYSALVSRAGGQGLTQGQWFKITDRSNVLALAITSTKVQYVNNNGVPVVDDLGTNVSYNITTENLVIDDVAGVYNASTNKLVFSFSETTPVLNTGDTNVDYVYGLQKRGNTRTQRKFRLSSFLSTVTGNDISWNGGFFLNFYNKLKSYFNTTGGVATHEALESICLDKYTLHEKQKLSITFAEVVYNGQWFTPLREALSAFVDKTQETVTGDVKLKLYKGNMINAGVTSPYSLYSEDFATFDADEVYNQKDSAGFINLFGLPIKVKAILDEQRKAGK